MTNEPQTGFRDPTGLTRWAKGSLYAYLALSLIVAWPDVRDLLGLGGQESATGLRLVVLRAFAMMAVLLANAIFVLTWIHRANHNARHLGADGMRYTPGWAVGWYFVPIAWFWKPYQAMKEIWKASADPADWGRQTVSPLLHWWWILWIVPFWGVSLVDWAVGRSLAEAGTETLDAAMSIVSSALDILLVFVLLAIMGTVNRMQMAHRQEQAAAD